MKIILTNQLAANYKISKQTVGAFLKIANMTIATEDEKRSLAEIPEALELSVCLTNDKVIRKLNKKYRHKDQATDVLSFPMYEAADKILPHSSLGDIVISLDTMARQAKEYGHSQHREICFLFVHGLLHLLGYDHELGKAEENLQFARQNEVLEILEILR